MRLIDTRTLQLKEFNDQELPAYAILSHRWYDNDQEEVSFQDLRDRRMIAHKRGFTKLQRFCDLARSLKYAYAWSDVCCINKDSDTELKTALNSMYRWYAISDLCIAYLEDVRPGKKALEDSEWFKRGWTLQELIAPRELSFYDGDWRHIGKKSNLLRRLSQISGVQEDILDHRTKISSCSVAQRMSWASARVTKRVEDRAYSLLGIFGITMETVYDGDGRRAFMQLQERIIQHSPDQSIFAWLMDGRNHPLGYSGMLAPSPDSFATCGDIVMVEGTTGFSLENIGLSISLLTIPYAPQTDLAFLDCGEQDKPDSRLGILITKHKSSEQYTRIAADTGKSLFVRGMRELQESKAVERRLSIQPARPDKQFRAGRVYGMRLRSLQAFESALKIRILSRTPIREKGQLRLKPGLLGTAGVIAVVSYSSASTLNAWATVRWVKVGFNDEFKPVIMVAREDAHDLAVADLKDFDRVAASKADFRTEARVFQSEWVRTNQLIEDQRIPSAADSWLKGYYILVPDELPAEHESMTYSAFEDLNIEVKISLLPARLPMTLKRSGVTPFIWTIDFLDLGRSVREQFLLRTYKRHWKTAKPILVPILSAVAAGFAGHATKGRRSTH